MQKACIDIKKHLLDLFERKKQEIDEIIRNKQQSILEQYKYLNLESEKMKRNEKNLERKYKLIEIENKRIKTKINNIKKLLKNIINELNNNDFNEHKEKIIKKIEMFEKNNEVEKWISELFK